MAGPRLALGTLLGGVALWFAFQGLGVEELLVALAGLDGRLVLAALASTGVTLLIGTARWQALFYPAHRELRFGNLFRANVIGQMVNILSPVRVGEVVRLYALADSQRLSKAQVLATLALEKVLDLFTFGVAAAVLVMLMAIPEDIRVRHSAQIGAGLAGFACLWLTARYAVPVGRRLERLMPALSPRWRAAAGAGLLRFVDGLAALRRVRTGAALFGLSLALLLCSALTNYLLFLAFGMPLPMWAALFLLVLLQLGTVPPSLPGRLGVFNYLVVVGLGVFGIDRAQALSYSFVLYAVALLPKVVVGALCLAVTPAHARATVTGE